MKISNIRIKSEGYVSCKSSFYSAKDSLSCAFTPENGRQLVRENNKTANKTRVYAYDARGNLTSRKTYAYTTGMPGALQDTDIFEYCDCKRFESGRRFCKTVQNGAQSTMGYN